MPTKAKLQRESLEIYGEINECLPMVTDGLIAHFPCAESTFDCVGGHHTGVDGQTLRQGYNSGVNLVELLNIDWRDPENWHLLSAEGESVCTVAWDEAKSALCFTGSGVWILGEGGSDDPNAGGYIYVDTAKSWYMEGVFKRVTGVNNSRTVSLGDIAFRDYKIYDAAIQHGGAAEYWAAMEEPSPLDTWVTYKNQGIGGAPRTGTDTAALACFHDNPRASYIRPVVAVNTSGTTNNTDITYVRGLNLYYEADDESNITSDTGEGIVIEKGAENLLISGGWTTEGIAGTADFPFYPPVHPCIGSAVASGSGLDLFRMSASLDLAAGGSVSLSGCFFIPEGAHGTNRINFYAVVDGSAEDTLLASHENLEKGWHFLHAVYVNPGTVSQTLTALRCENGTTAQWAGGYNRMWGCNYQLELGNHPTAFTLSSRDDARCELPLPSGAFINGGTIEGTFIVEVASRYALAPEASGAGERVILGSDTGCDSGGFILYLDEGDRLSFTANAVTGEGIDDLTWGRDEYHVIALSVSESGGYVRLYCDGLLQASAVYAELSFNYMKLAYRLDGTPGDFTCKNMSFYNRALSAAEILKYGSSPFSLCEDGLIVREIVERPVGIPVAACYFPLSGEEGKSEYNYVSPLQAENIVAESGGMWIGSAAANLIPESAQSFSSGWSGNSGASVTVTQLSGGKTRLQTGGGTEMEQYVCNAADPSAAAQGYSAALWVHNIGSFSVRVSARIDASIVYADVPAGEITRVTLEGLTGDGASQFRLCLGGTAAGSSLDMIVWEPMASAMPFVAPFTASVRGIAYLNYQLSDIGINVNSGDWTAVLWAAPNACSFGVTGDTFYGRAPLMEMGAYAASGQASLTLGKLEDMAGALQFQVYDGGTAITSVDPVTLTASALNGWMLCALRRDAAAGAFHVSVLCRDGIVHRTLTVSLSNTISDVLRIGAGAATGGGTDLLDTARWNGLVRDLVVEDRCWSDAELEAMYKTVTKATKKALQVAGYLKVTP